MQNTPYRSNIYRLTACLFLSVTSFTGFSQVQKNGAEIIRLTKETMNLAPKGKERDAMIGDWLIRNEQVVAVVADAYPEREANQMVSSIQGAVIDFTSREANNDQLVVYYPQGARIDVPSADTILVLQSKGNVVQLKAVKYATKAEPFIAETIYTLKAGEAFLHVATTYRNPSNRPLKVVIYDMLRCDNKLEGNGPAGQVTLAFLYNKWYHAAYGVVPASGTLTTPEKVENGALTNQGIRFYYGKGPKDSVLIEPGKEVRVDRNLLTGKDIAGLKAQETTITGASLLPLETLVKDRSGKALANVFIEAYNDKKELVSASITGVSGKSAWLLPPGKYHLEASKLGHDTVSHEVTLPLQAPVVFDLKVESHLSFHINAAEADGKIFPVKVEFKGVSGTKSPNLGPATRSNGAGPLYYSKATDFTVAVAEGDYEVVVSHGAEYDAETMVVKVRAGENKLLQVNLKRAFSTPGYLIADLHNHSTGSGDSNTGTADRVINLAASGVEFAPATEHNRISTYSEVIRQEGLGKFIASAPGIELSGRPGPGSTNHQIAFPLKIEGGGKRGFGAPKTDRNPFIQMKRLYDYDNGSVKLMQQNHPEISQLYFDKNTDGIADGGYGTEKITDVMEIRETMQALPAALTGGNKNTRSFQWLQMLNLGYHIYGTANSDNHAIGHPSGGQFNYIYTRNDIPAKADSMELALQVKKGHVIMSTGPFMEVQVNNALPGDEIKAPGGKTTVAIKVLTANWCRVNTVMILVNGKIDSSLVFTKQKNAALFKSGPVVFEQSIPVTLKSDAHLIVVAYGAGENVGIVTGGAMKNNMPMALANPVFVDTDGNGFTPNKDLLGAVLPVKPGTRKADVGEENE